MKQTRLYMVWAAMRQRCRNPQNPSYVRYGGRGVYVDPRWDDYPTFKDWAYSSGYIDPEPGVRSKLQIDRIDNDGPYSPENCRWVSQLENIRAKPQRVHEAFGELRTLQRWAEDPRCRCPLGTLRSRVYRDGWTLERALTTPSHPKGYNGAPRGNLHQSSKTHCPKGHEYTEENTRITSQGKRRCRACWG